MNFYHAERSLGQHYSSTAHILSSFSNSIRLRNKHESIWRAGI